MTRKVLRFAGITMVLSCVLTIFSCRQQLKYEPDEEIVAKVGDKTISVNEFIKRAEYTIRPNYVKMDYPIQKQIILNSLIAEKLFALEGEEHSQLLQNERFQAFIKGRMEQTMRYFMYQSEAKDKIHLTDEEIKEKYQLAGRTYRVRYFSLEDSAKARQVADVLSKGEISFEAMYEELSGTSEPQIKEVSWGDKENPQVMDALFNKSLSKDQVLPPLQMDDGYSLFMKVDGWTDSHILNEEGMKQRWNDVREKLIIQKANKAWAQQVAEVMRGKEIVFHENTFMKLVDLLGPQYYRTSDEVKGAFKQNMWNQEAYEVVMKSLDDPNFVNEPFFKLDGKTWTVSEFRMLLESHPLAFRKQHFPKSDFAEQFKLAAVDLVRDYYMTQEAYRKGYDKANVVKREKMMWQDAFVAKEYRQKFLQEKHETRSFGKEYLNIMKDYLNSDVQQLQQKYTDVIEINTDLFDTIDITRIDMYATYQDAPYRTIVPEFPIYTTEHRFNYGHKMKTR